MVTFQIDTKDKNIVIEIEKLIKDKFNIDVSYNIKNKDFDLDNIESIKKDNLDFKDIENTKKENNKKYSILEAKNKLGL